MAPLPIPDPNSQAVNTGGGVPSFIAVWWDFFNSLASFVTGPGDRVGFTDGSSAPAGDVGEYKNSVVQSGAAVALTTNTSANVLTLALTAGDWDVWGDIFYTGAASVAVFQIEGWIGTVSVTVPSPLPAPITYLQDDGGALWAGVNPITVNGLRTRVSSATSVTLFLSTRTSFTTGTLAAYGQLQARRMR